MENKLHQYTGPEVRLLRKKSGMNQREFWSLFGVTQSGGSRYESGRDLPGPLNVLLNIAFQPPAKSAVTVEMLRAKKV
jgi:DNA-binding transcriptional regulator YiaG